MKPAKDVITEDANMSEEFSAEPDKVLDDVRVDVSDAFTNEVTTDPDSIIKTTQSVRVGMLKQMTNHGRALPKDEDDVKLTLQLMRDMDATAQTASKLSIDAKATTSAEQVAAMANKFAETIRDMSTGISRETRPDAAFELPEHEFSEEEMAQGEAPLAADEYLTTEN